MSRTKITPKANTWDWVIQICRQRLRESDKRQRKLEECLHYFEERKKNKVPFPGRNRLTELKELEEAPKI